MSETIPRADFSGPLHLGNATIDAYVVEQEGEFIRILSTRGVMKSLGRRWRGRKYAGTKLPVFLEAKNLRPFIDKELEVVLTPIIFRTDKGVMSEGFNAEVLPKICEVFLDAREADVLLESQKNTAKQSEILLRGLATVGIIALVDEATGYQEIRDSIALRKILDRYITDEWAKWSKTFPDEFYKELFRLKGIPYPPSEGGKKPSYVGHWTNDIVYSRLAPGVLKELKRQVPRMPGGSRKRKFHQHLTPDIGHPALKEHLSKVIFLMKGFIKWTDFKRALARAAEKYGDTIQLPLDD